ncbi:uncharacterized protein LOC131438346 isoform X2 [Malaya genurostris]|uniref:uncharacterized protein LOC131438346 isoform X2 n=1 Tax=Malaya genurostris TaxID=325434 RepID=UPI0026F3A965|nr:uncharacterized protein LOC131438346 isoform X2 [Malaya genurostris]XP_058464286.1 uncharacterized protein LOC131438346 isoform X2 [Malaya genurostris]
MARRPKRSALMQAFTIVALCLASLVIQCSGVSSSSGELSDLIAEESRNYRELLNIPRFGDRLSPRNRPHVEEPNTGTGIANVVGSSLAGVSNTSGSKFRRQPGPGNLYPGVSYRNAGRISSIAANHDELHTLVKTNDIKRSDVMVTSVTQNLGDTNSDSDSEYYAVSDDIEDVQRFSDQDNEEIEGEGDGDSDLDEEHKHLENLTVESRSVDSSYNVQHSLLESNSVKDNSLSLLVGQQNISSGSGANASSAQAHRLEMSTEFFVVPSTASPAASRSTSVRPGGVILAARNPTSHHNSHSNTHKLNVTPPTVIATSYPSGLRKEPWVVPVLVLASLSMIMMAAFEIFVLCKAWRTSPSRRHLFLGQMLLLGLFACAGLAAVLTVNPTVLSCATMRFGAGVAFALVFASLLVKCVFLISLNGGVYLPAPYQGLLLLFAVLIQVAVGAQWLLTDPPIVDQVPISNGGTAISSRYYLLLTANDLAQVNPTIPLCHTSFSELLLSLIYVVFLIIFVAILAIKSRGIRDNYREATYIGLAVGGIIPIWLGWTLCGLAVADRHRDACLAFGLVATASTVFLVMFMPKGRQLAAMGKEGLYVEDREERFSSLSRAGSGYSPSFFHFKPIKYGVMGASPTLQTNNGTVVGTTTTSKHQAVATLGGDRVALVTAPPSYTPRMYHYFPAHMTHPFCYYPSPAPQQARYPGTWYNALYQTPSNKSTMRTERVETTSKV